MDSESEEIKKLEKKVRELEATLKQEQLKADILNKILESAKWKLNIDSKKKSSVPSKDNSDKD